MDRAAVMIQDRILVRILVRIVGRVVVRILATIFTRRFRSAGMSCSRVDRV